MEDRIIDDTKLELVSAVNKSIEKTSLTITALMLESILNQINEIKRNKIIQQDIKEEKESEE